MLKEELLSQLYKHLADTLTISNTKIDEIIRSYRAVGTYLGNLEEELDIRVFAQGSLSLGTIIKPTFGDKKGEYDVDLVCLLENGSQLPAAEIKELVGNRLKESSRYNSMLDEEGRRCWTLNYNEFHLDVLPCVPTNRSDTRIRLTHRNEDTTYSNRFSNPKAYKKWFVEEMETVFLEKRNMYATENKLEIEEVEVYQVRTPLQMAIQILKRHRDIMFKNKQHKPISIIITTLAAKAYSGETDIFQAISNILINIEKYIEVDTNGEILILNPTDTDENFADKWKEVPDKKTAFFQWLKQAKQDIISDPLNFADGLDSLKKHMKDIYGSDTVDIMYEKYAASVKNERELGKLGITNKGNVTSDTSKMIVPLKDHTFYGW